MLNIIKNKTETVPCRIYLNKSGVKFRLSDAFVGKRFRLSYGKESIMLVEDAGGVAYHSWTAHNGKPYHRICFGPGWLPFKPFNGAWVDMNAIYDGKTLVMKTPVFQVTESKKKARRNTPENFSDLGEAISTVNDLARRYKCELVVMDGVLSGTIRI